MIGNDLAINLRQKTGEELSFVSLVNGTISTYVILYTAGVAPGEYSLVLESYDLNSNGAVPATLKTDTISIIVEEPLNPPYFTEELKT